jgi:excisionase family DNA binding protein
MVFAMSSISTERLLTLDEVAARLGLKRRTVLSKIRRGQLPAYQLGGKGSAIRVDPAELERWLQSPPGAAK